MYGNDFLAQAFTPESGDKTVLGLALTQYGIAWTLLRPCSGAAAIRDRRPGWKRDYADERAVVHRRSDVGASGAWPVCDELTRIETEPRARVCCHHQAGHEQAGTEPPQFCR